MDKRRAVGIAVAGIAGILLAALLVPDGAPPEPSTIAVAPAPRAPAPRTSVKRRPAPAVSQPAVEPEPVAPLDDVHDLPEARVVRCAGPDLPAEYHLPVRIFLGDYQMTDARVTLVGGELTIPTEATRGQFKLAVPGYLPVSVAINGESCTVYGEAREAGVLTGRVANGGDRGWVSGCGNMAWVIDDAYELTLAEDGPCWVQAARMDGALKVLSRLVEVDPRPGETERVDLDLPSRQQGGMGVSFRPGDDGVDVVDVRPGTPAYAAGLAAGDRILAVDGEPVAGMASDDFIWLGVGDVGSTVHLEVEHSDGSLEALSLERAFISG